MSETKNKGNAVPACSSLETDNKTRGLEIVDGAMGPSKEDVAVQPGMEIPAVTDTISNERPDGKIEVRKKGTGELIAILEPDGTISRKLEEIDRPKEGATDKDAR